MKDTVKIRNLNRRRSRRARAKTWVQAECRPGGYGLGPNLSQRVLDLSETGVRLIVREPLEVAAEVEIILSAYGLTRPLKRVGVVRWQLSLDDGHFCVGIEFQRPLPYRELLVLVRGD